MFEESNHGVKIFLTKIYPIMSSNCYCLCKGYKPRNTKQSNCYCLQKVVNSGIQNCEWNFCVIGWNSPIYKVLRPVQGEVVAIQATAGIMGDVRVCKRNVTIHSDSQAAFKAKSTNVTNSKMVYGCR